MLPSPSMLINHHQTKLSRKQKRRRARSSSVFTSTSTDTSRADQELETAKAAALKLLDHSTHRQPTCDDDEHLSPPKPKRTRFETIITTITEEDTPVNPPNRSNPSELKPIKPIIPESQAVDHQDPPSHPPSQPAPKNLPSQPLASLSSSNPRPPSSTSKVQVEDFFQVSREEIFADAAILDAFQAAMNEFQSSSHQQLGLPDSITLPQSRSEQRQTSALYYGQPPVRAAVKTKKPPSNKIFLPPIINPVRSSSVVSDLDMDEYWDLVGGRSESGSVVADLQVEEPRNDLEDVDREENVEAVRDDRPCSSDMMSSSGSSSSFESSNQLQSHSSTTTLTTNPTPPLLSPAPLKGGPEILTEAQKLLLSNALSAQYWAGYHTALFNHSIGMNPTQIFNPSTCIPVAPSSTNQLHPEASSTKPPSAPPRSSV